MGDDGSMNDFQKSSDSSESKDSLSKLELVVAVSSSDSSPWNSIASPANMNYDEIMKTVLRDKCTKITY